MILWLGYLSCGLASAVVGVILADRLVRRQTPLWFLVAWSVAAALVVIGMSSPVP